MFNLTPAAAEQIRKAASSQDAAAETAPQPPTLRVAAKIESGEIVYGMGFDDERENDRVIDSNGIILLIAPPSQELLSGATLDFVELHPGEFQFIFINPNEPGPVDACPPTACQSCGSAKGCKS